MAYTEVYPKTENDILQEKKIDQFKKEIPNIMLAPFNKTRWSRI